MSIRIGKSGSGQWVERRQGGAGLQACMQPPVMHRALAPAVPQRLKPQGKAAFNAALKRCSTHINIHPNIKIHRLMGSGSV